MTERDRELLNKINARLQEGSDEWPETMVIGCLRIIDRLDKELAEIKAAAEILLGGQQHQKDFRRLAKALKEVKHGKH